MSQSIQLPVNSSCNQSVNQSINQSFNQSINPSGNHYLPCQLRGVLDMILSHLAEMDHQVSLKINITYQSIFNNRSKVQKIHQYNKKSIITTTTKTIQSINQSANQLVIQLKSINQSVNLILLSHQTFSQSISSPEAILR